MHAGSVPEKGMIRHVPGRVGVANHLTEVIDGGGVTGGEAEVPQIVHPGAVPEEGVTSTLNTCLADNLSPIVDGLSVAVSPAQGSQVGDCVAHCRSPRGARTCSQREGEQRHQRLTDRLRVKEY